MQMLYMRERELCSGPAYRRQRSRHQSLQCTALPGHHAAEKEPKRLYFGMHDSHLQVNLVGAEVCSIR